ncbi:MAG: isopeptide-forming domain-containing fimbrial protein, partial [Patescibacteria group bacterium]
ITTLTNTASAVADNAPTVNDTASVLVTGIVQNTTLTIQKFGKNITRGDTSNQTSLNAKAGDTIEFDLIISAPANTTLYNVVVADVLPAGLTYSNNSTALNNTIIGEGITYGGVNIGTLYSGQQATVKFFARVNPNVTVNQIITNTANARADNVPLTNSQPVQITINGAKIIMGALYVPTGPTTDVFALAGFGGLISSALYVAKRKGLNLIRLA